MNGQDKVSTLVPKLLISPCRLMSVHDADTFRVYVPIEFAVPTMTWVPNIRLAHVNAAELSTDLGKTAAAKVNEWFLDDDRRTFTVMFYGPDKYGRSVGDVATDANELLSTYVLSLEGSVPLAVQRQILHP